MSRVPILTILGSTGSGKSRLSIELARRFSGEIISADSMQIVCNSLSEESYKAIQEVYKGLDIVTAKVTKEEQEMAPHHMLDVVDPLSSDFTVTQFRDMTLPIINDLLARGKLPIVVGGTNYYIESLLWKILLPQFEKNDALRDERSDSPSPERSDEKEELSPAKKLKVELDRRTNQSNEELFQKLTEVDPEMAKRLHPNNRRKVIRSLEVFEQYGVTHSQLLKTQRTAGGSGLGGPLRHPNSIILWLRCDKKILDQRLDSRVDDMLDAGLVEELHDFHRRYNEQRIQSNTDPDYTTGIFQSIGFKEFHDYLILPEEEKREKKGKELLSKGTDFLKLVTKRYARKQEKWVTNRLIRRIDRQVPPIYTLDCTYVDKWNHCVYEPAVAIIDAVLKGEKPAQKPVNESVDNAKITDASNEECHHCDICERIFIGDHQWNIHLQSIKHKRVLKKKKQLAQAIQEEKVEEQDKEETRK